MYKNKKAFTLIELLVVVLIIGILSAIALPQYTKAVEKARAAEGELMLRTLLNAQARCFLEKGQESEQCMQNGNEDDLFDNMDITVSGDRVNSVDTGCTDCALPGKYFVYSLDADNIQAERVNGNQLLYRLNGSSYYRNAADPITCYSPNNSSVSCKDVGYTVQLDSFFWKKP